MVLVAALEVGVLIVKGVERGRYAMTCSLGSLDGSWEYVALPSMSFSVCFTFIGTLSLNPM